VRLEGDLVDAELYADLPQPPRDEGPAEETPVRAWNSGRRRGSRLRHTPHVYAVLFATTAPFVSLEPVPSASIVHTVFKNFR